MITGNKKSLFSWLIFFLALNMLTACKPKEIFIKPDNENISYIGRVDFSDPVHPAFMYSGVTIRTIFDGTAAYAILKDDSARNRFSVTVDSITHIIHMEKGDSVYMLAKDLENTVHFLQITRITEWHGGNTIFSGLKITGSGLMPVLPHDRKIEFIGNSITCGYGADGKSHDEHFSYESENCLHTFAAYTAQNLKADYMMTCRSGIGMYQSYGGDTSFAMPKLYNQAITGSNDKWDFSKFIPDVVVIELGTNDLSSNVDSLSYSRAYTGFIKELRDHYAHSKIVCMSGPGTIGEDRRNRHFADLVKAVVDEASKNIRNVYYYGMEPTAHNGSDWHPSAAEHRGLSKGLTSFLRNLMGWKE